MTGCFKTGLRLMGLATLTACIVSLGVSDAFARGGHGGGGFGGGHFGGGGFGGGGFDRGGFGTGFGDRGSFGGSWHADGFHPARDDPAGFDHARVVNHYYRDGCRDCRVGYRAGYRAATNDDYDDDDFDYDPVYNPYWGLPTNCDVAPAAAYYDCGPSRYQAAYGNNGVYYSAAPK